MIDPININLEVEEEGAIPLKSDLAVRTTIPAIDDTLTISGAAADAKKTGDEINDLKSAIEDVSGLSDEAKDALLACFAYVAWSGDDGQDYYDALEAALYPTAELVSISAVYTQSGTVYTTDTLDSLKSDLVVTATYEDSSTEVVTTYTLSGTLTVGTSTITVSYGGKTTTFNVTVTEPVATPLYDWDFRNNNLTDSVNGIVAETTATQTVDGIKFEAASRYLMLTKDFTVDLRGKTVEIDVESMSDNSNASHARLFMNSQYSSGATSDSSDGLIRRSTGVWSFYNGAWSGNSLPQSSYPGSYFSGKTIVLSYDADGYCTLSVDGNDLITFDNASTRIGHLVMGGSSNDFLYLLAPTISGVRIYGEV